MWWIKPPFTALNKLSKYYYYYLLLYMSDAKVGCYIGNVFVGGLAYADDIVLLPPTARAMRKLLSSCDEFASEFNVLFNARNSKCLYIRPKDNSCLKPILISVETQLNLFGSGQISVI